MQKQNLFKEKYLINFQGKIPSLDQLGSLLDGDKAGKSSEKTPGGAEKPGKAALLLGSLKTIIEHPIKGFKAVKESFKKFREAEWGQKWEVFATSMVAQLSAIEGEQKKSDEEVTKEVDGPLKAALGTQIEINEPSDAKDKEALDGTVRDSMVFYSGKLNTGRKSDLSTAMTKIDTAVASEGKNVTEFTPEEGRTFAAFGINILTALRKRCGEDTAGKDRFQRLLQNLALSKRKGGGDYPLYDVASKATKVLAMNLEKLDQGTLARMANKLGIVESDTTVLGSLKRPEGSTDTTLATDPKKKVVEVMKKLFPATAKSANGELRLTELTDKIYALNNGILKLEPGNAQKEIAEIVYLPEISDLERLSDGLAA